MENEPELIIRDPELKTADKRTYMREYKKKKYDENPIVFKDNNKMYYAKYKYNISTDDCKKYGKNLQSIVKIKKLLEELKQNDNEVFRDIIKEIIHNYL